MAGVLLLHVAVNPVHDWLETICPDRRHEVRVATNAAARLQMLETGVRKRLVEMLCDVAEVASLAPDATEFRGPSRPFAVRAGQSIVLYTLDNAHAVTVHHVVEAEAVPAIA
jgi:hypothetical protein